MKQIDELLDQIAKESQAKYGRSLDLALFSEYAFTAGKSGTAREIAVPVDETTVKPLGEMAKKYYCNLVVGGVFLDGTHGPTCSNAAIVIDRDAHLSDEQRKKVFGGNLRPIAASIFQDKGVG